MTPKTKYSVKPVFNPVSYGLAEPHYAVLAHLPPELGGETDLVDLVPEKDLRVTGQGPEDLKSAVEDAASLMPWDITDPDGLVIEFQRRTQDGQAVKQSTMYLPLRGDGPAGQAKEYHSWLAWRVRTALYFSERDRKAFDPVLETRLVLTHTQVQLNEEPAFFERKLAVA